MVIVDASPIDQSSLCSVAEVAVNENVEAPEQAKGEIVSRIRVNIESWFTEKPMGLLLKCVEDEEIVGFILIKDYWNLSDFFVLPQAQGKGVGLSLWQSALSVCEARSQRQSIRVNSSTNAIGFYESVGFRQIAVEQKLPPWVVSMEVSL